MAVHPNILAWKNFMDRGAWWATIQRIGHDWVTEHEQEQNIGDSSRYFSQLRCSLPELKEVSFRFIAQLADFLVTGSYFYSLLPSFFIFLGISFSSHVPLLVLQRLWSCILEKICNILKDSPASLSVTVISSWKGLWWIILSFFFTLLLPSDGVVCLWKACATS